MAETFGKTDKGTLEASFGANSMILCKYQSGSAGTLQSITLYIYNKYSVVNKKVKCAIYDSSYNLLTNGTTEEKVVPTDQDGWMTFNFSTAPSVAASTTYCLALWLEDGQTCYRDAGESGQQPYQTVYGYDGWPDPFAPFASHDFAVSIYATYKEEAHAPTAPTGQQVNGQSAPTGENCISSLTPGFTAIYNDPDAGDISNAINIQVGTASGLSDMWDSGWLADSTVTPNRCTAKTYAGAALATGTSYWWRCRFRDDGGLEGAWSEWQQFDMCAAATLVQMALI